MTWWSRTTPTGLLRWAGESPPTLYELDGGKRVMSLSSILTKTVAPGLRIGYVVAPVELASAVGKHAENAYILALHPERCPPRPGSRTDSEAGYFEPGVERAKAEAEGAKPRVASRSVAPRSRPT